MKRALGIDPIGDRYIELPDPRDSERYYGNNLYLRLIRELWCTKRFAVLVQRPGRSTPSGVDRKDNALQTDQCETPDDISNVPPDPVRLFSQPIASSFLTMTMNELSFTTGSRADRLMYGFIRGFENPYNDGKESRNRNEYVVRLFDPTLSWFAPEFEDFNGDLHTGKELGHEITVNAVIGGGTLQYANYKARLGMSVLFENRGTQTVRKDFLSKGKGFFYDISGFFANQTGTYRLGFVYARKVAFLQAFEKLVTQTIQMVTNEVLKLPLYTKILARRQNPNVSREDIYIAAGANYRVPVGQRFYDRTQVDNGISPTVFIVREVFQTVSRVEVVSRSGHFAVGEELVSINPNDRVPQPTSRTLASTDGVKVNQSGLGSGNSPVSVEQIQAEFEKNFKMPSGLDEFKENPLVAFFSGIVGTVTLPYRLWRYYQYDQKYEGPKSIKIPTVNHSRSLANSVHHSWAFRRIGAQIAWTKFGVGSRSTKVAVIDSGIDYNHDELRNQIFWDGHLGINGFDFISGDVRAYDDHAHGTEISSVMAAGGEDIIGVSPNSFLMPLKVFSPYGMTNSGAILEAFKYAIHHKADVIVVAWQSLIRSKALQDGIDLAEREGIPVVTSAGEYGISLDERDFYPAKFRNENLIVVAGLGKNGRLLRTSKYKSNYSSTYVHIAAPAEGILVANPRNNYSVRSHTGLAAGFVAGAILLAKSICPRADARQVKTALLEGSRINISLSGQVIDNKELYLPLFLDYISQTCN
ncbi:MAG: S8 family serine peptidase [Bacteriovoracia bacterium]